MSSASDSSSSKVMALNVKFVVKEECRNDFIQAIQADQRDTLANEPNVLQFVVGQCIDNKNLFCLHEQYKSATDLDYHESTQHFKTFQQYCTESNPFVEEPVVNKYLCSHTPKVISSRLTGTFCLNVESCIKAEVRDEFITLMTQHQKDSLAEVECLQFDWGESCIDSNTFYIHEEYTNKQGYDAHETTSHFDRFIKFNTEKKPYSKPQVVNFYTIL